MADEPQVISEAAWATTSFVLGWLAGVTDDPDCERISNLLDDTLRGLRSPVETPRGTDEGRGA